MNEQANFDDLSQTNNPDGKATHTPHETLARLPSFAAVTSSHKTHLPSIDSFLTLTGSFGPGIVKQPALWGSEQGFYLTTPTGQLRVEGQNGPENTSLQHYVASQLGPDGLKHLTALLEIYDMLTQGSDQKTDVEITVKQLLQRLGREEHANDKDEQDSVLNTALYLARTYVTIISAKTRRSSPLLVLEAVRVDTAGNTFIRYHLGIEFFDALYGLQKQFHVVPTGQLLGYHAVKSQHELLLLFYLAHRLSNGQGKYAVSFIALCVESGIYALERLQPKAKNRMRDALQVLNALERLETDGLIRRHEHPDIDLIQAINLCLNPLAEQQVAPVTKARIRPLLKSLKNDIEKDLTRKRRNALQRMLYMENDSRELVTSTTVFSPKIIFQEGDLLASELQNFPLE